MAEQPVQVFASFLGDLHTHQPLRQFYLLGPFALLDHDARSVIDPEGERHRAAPVPMRFSGPALRPSSSGTFCGRPAGHNDGSAPYMHNGGHPIRSSNGPAGGG
jgi:hypothetical protein